MDKFLLGPFLVLLLLMVQKSGNHQLTHYLQGFSTIQPVVVSDFWIINSRTQRSTSIFEGQPSKTRPFHSNENMEPHLGSRNIYTLPKFNMEPKNDGFQVCNLLLQGAILTFFQVNHVKL